MQVELMAWRWLWYQPDEIAQGSIEMVRLSEEEYFWVGSDRNDAPSM